MTATQTHEVHDTKSPLSPYANRDHTLAMRRRKIIMYGVAMTLAVLLVILLIVATFGGTFTNFMPAKVQLPVNGNALGANAPVVYRNVTVGKVTSLGKPGPNNTVFMDLHLKAADAKKIPANVTAQVGPETVFGNESLVLMVPHSAKGHLAAHQVIGATPGSTSSFQTLIANIDNVLRSVHPATLFTAFSALAQALQGQGPNFAATIRDSDQFLRSVLPDLPVFEQDIAEVGPVANTFAAATPDLLGALNNSSTIAQNLLANQTNFDQFLRTTNPLLVNGENFLNGTQTSIIHLLQDFSPFLLDVNQSPTEVSDTLNGLDAWAKSWYGAEQQGPYLSFSATVPVANLTDLILAAVNAPGAPGLAAQGLAGILNPPNYNSKASYPNGPKVAAATSGTSPFVTTDVTTPASSQAVGQIFSGINHGNAPANAQVADVLLNPILVQSAQGGAA